VSYDVLISNVPKEKEFRKPEAYNMDKRSLESFVTKYKKLMPGTLEVILMTHRRGPNYLFGLVFSIYI